MLKICLDNKAIHQIMTKRICQLFCINNSHKPIELPHNDDVFVGRTRVTNISDVGLSRKQVKLVADLNTSTVKLTQLGVNPSGVNGYKLNQNVSYTLRHKDRLELLLDKYIYEVVFTPAPNSDTHIIEEDTNKRKNNDIIENSKTKERKLHVQKENYWEEIDNKNLYIFTSEGVESREKIAAYDVDGTIITTKSGARFAKDVSDYKILFPEVKKKIKEMNNNGYKIVFFTNQAGVATGKTNIKSIKQKMEDIVKQLGVPVQIFIAPTRTIYRKPAPGMWEALINEKNDGVEIDLTKSFYVGDAAGREQNWAPKKKKDHSFADRLFALNIGVEFHTPEEHFLGARKVKFAMPVFDPRNCDMNIGLCEPAKSNIASDEQEVIVMVGGPGSGKSFICREYLIPKNYIHVNRDKLGSWQKCANELEKYLQQKKKVIVDNTNPDIESRKRYVDIAKKYNVPIRCFVMKTSIHQAKHNNFFREITDKSHQQVTDIIINSYKNKYKEPEEKEGFLEIIKINCIPKFEDDKLHKLYHMFLLDK